MESKIVKRPKKEIETVLSSEEKIITLQNIIIEKNNEILKLQQQVSDLQAKHDKKKAKSPSTSETTQPFEVTLKGLDNEHNNVYSSEK